jgi:hypothetical protein
LSRNLLSVLSACAVAALLAGGCAGHAGVDFRNGQTSLRYPSTYNPLAPALATPRGVARVAELPGQTLAGRTLIATTAEDEADAALQQKLALDGQGAHLTIRLTDPAPNAVVYVRYDSEREHLASSNIEPTACISLVHEVEPGLIAVAVAPVDTAMLAAGPLAQLHFAPGGNHGRRNVSTITNDLRSKVDDLTVTDNANTSVTLQWSERNTGDYDLNGEVNGSDLVRIGQHFKKAFTASDTDYAQLEVVDGDSNGEINAADITPIAQNYKSFIAGYNIYRTALSSASEQPDPADTPRWTKVPNTLAPTGPSAPRQWNGQDFRLVYTFIDQSGPGDFGWYIRPTSTLANDEGRSSDAKTLTVGGGTPPDAGLSFEIQPPQGNAIAVNDDIYIGVRITGAADLFSANVRFEYDANLLQFVEAVPAYTDGSGTHLNLLSPPLFIGADNVGSATSPYHLLGFNATETFGTPAVTGDGILGYVHFKALALGINTEAIRFPQSTNFIYLWGTQYGVPVGTPALGDPLSISVL